MEAYATAMPGLIIFMPSCITKFQFSPVAMRNSRRSADPKFAKFRPDCLQTTGPTRGANVTSAVRGTRRSIHGLNAQQDCVESKAWYRLICVNCAITSSEHKSSLHAANACEAKW